MPKVQPEPAPSESTIHFRLEFAQRCFTNIQELIRFMDQKTGYVIAAIGILTAALGTFATRAMGTAPLAEWQIVVRYAALAFCFIYLILAFIVIYMAVQVYTARPSLLRPQTSAPGMIFPLMVLDHFKMDENKYLAALSQTTPEKMLQDYAHEVMEIANIYKIKQTYVNAATGLLRWLCFIWVVAILSLIAITLAI
jgi:hypothetical protein